WQSAWNAVKGSTNADERAIGDLILAHWPALLASLGRSDEINHIVQENGTTKLGRLDQQQRLNDVMAAVEFMSQNPGLSYRCGTLALFSVATALGSTNHLQTILDCRSPRTGFSIADILEISQRSG